MTRACGELGSNSSMYWKKTPFASCSSISSRPQYHIQDDKSQITTEHRPKLDPALDKLLICGHEIAANPADLKIKDQDLFVTSYPNVLDSDSSDAIESDSSFTTKFEVGERITEFAAVTYNGKIYHGAWQSS
ncbi:hypothetical protein BOTNAR_0035g00260 [Botryotinia narcissicola]|uniref:Uncharacterized protein n=1 Tax=Botryotinia narcissicola TaxID=278944 RepID=A0A4Z1JFT7_9HELO|nr:hypothetical protein BOTNAR_0035g00260 [Botryotinia narcissicola]